MFNRLEIETHISTREITCHQMQFDVHLQYLLNRKITVTNLLYCIFGFDQYTNVMA